MKGLRTAILLLLSSLSISCFAQDEPEKATAIINFPSNFFNRIQSKTTSLDGQLQLLQPKMQDADQVKEYSANENSKYPR
jgi:hypothetical protein